MLRLSDFIKLLNENKMNKMLYMIEEKLYNIVLINI